jgi:hypothetical protein
LVIDAAAMLISIVSGSIVNPKLTFSVISALLALSVISGGMQATFAATVYGGGVSTIREIYLFAGTPILRHQWGRVTLTIGALPLGTRIGYDSISWRCISNAVLALPRLLRGVIVLRDPILCFVLAMLLLGPGHALASVWHDTVRILQVPLHPATLGATTVAHLATQTRGFDLPTLLGEFAAGMSAFYLLPLAPYHHGWVVLFTLLFDLPDASTRHKKRPIVQRLIESYAVISWLLGCGLRFGWIAALVFAAGR